MPTPTGPKEGSVVPITSAKESFSEYTLEDGTTLKMRPAVVEVVRLDETWDDEGNPTYLVRSAQIMTVEAPPGLRRGGDTDGD